MQWKQLNWLKLTVWRQGADDDDKWHCLCDYIVNIRVNKEYIYNST